MAVLEVGAEAPGFSLPDHTGTIRSLDELASGKRLALILFRGRW